MMFLKGPKRVLISFSCEAFLGLLNIHLGIAILIYVSNRIHFACVYLSISTLGLTMVEAEGKNFEKLIYRLLQIAIF